MKEKGETVDRAVLMRKLEAILDEAERAAFWGL